MNLLILILTFTLSWSQSFTRFEQNQLSFELSESDGTFVKCTHKPLESVTTTPPPPWWVVTCGDRKYTTDLWLEQRQQSESIKSIMLLYHAKEGVRSSGEHITRFETQTTKFFYEGKASYRFLRSSIDVRNGLADLYVQVNLSQTQ